MPMRTNCRYYESRSYPNGETVRKCDLDLAPEAPWRCPDNCPKYTPRSVDLGWDPGTLGVRDFAKEPPSLGEDDSIAALLDAAEDIINEAGPRVLADVEVERAAQQGFFGRLKRRFGRSR